MASFSAIKLSNTTINNGNEFTNGTFLTAETINAIINGILFAQENGGGGDISFSPQDSGKFLVVGTDGKVVAQSIAIGDNIYYG